MLNISIPSAELKKIAKKLSSVNSQNTTIGDKISAADSDMGIVLPGFKIEKDLVVNSKLLYNLVNKLTKDVQLSTDDTSLVIKSDRFTAKVPLLVEPPAPIPSPESELAKLDHKTLMELLTFAGSVTSEGATFDHTGAVLITPDGAKGTDNLRIAMVDMKTGCPDILIPTKVIKAIRDLDGPEIIISQSASCLFFQSNGVTVFTKKLNKKFPDIEKVIPKSYKLEAEINLQELSDSLQRISPTVDPEKPMVVFDFDGDKLKISTPTAEDEIPIIPIVPDAFDEPYKLKLGINNLFFQKCLTNFKSYDTIFMKGNNTGSPFMIEAGNKKLLMAGMRI